MIDYWTDAQQRGIYLLSRQLIMKLGLGKVYISTQLVMKLGLGKLYVSREMVMKLWTSSA